MTFTYSLVLIPMIGPSLRSSGRVHSPICLIGRVRHSSTKITRASEDSSPRPEEKSDVKKPRMTQAEADAALIAAYREKFGGETTATFEDGKPSEMGRAVRNNMFRCKTMLECCRRLLIHERYLNDLIMMWSVRYWQPNRMSIP